MTGAGTDCRERSRLIDPRRAWSRIDWLALASVAAGAGILRFAGLARPIGFVIDEIFYAQNGCLYTLGPTACGIEQLASSRHPPLANWLIGLGIQLFGYHEFGWRVTAALAGTLTVAVLYVLVRRLLADRVAAAVATVGAFVAALLLAVDFLHLVQSRVAMLDVFVTFFVVLAILFVVLDGNRDRREVERRGLRAALQRLSLGRPWLLLTGLSLGAATASKWSGAYAGVAVVAILLAYEMGASLADTSAAVGEHGFLPRLWAAVRRELPRSLVLLGLAPLVVYLASYIGHLPGTWLAWPWESGSFWRGIWDHQISMLRFHISTTRNHPYESPPWSWLLLKRPVAYYFRIDGASYREILAIGNPLTWWAGAVALVVLSVAWIRRGAQDIQPELVIVAAALGTFLPWLVLTGSRGFVFIWYLLPSVPFMCAALGVLAAGAWATVRGRVAILAAGIGVAVSFAFFFPVLTAQPLTPNDWRARIWFTDCARPDAPTLELPNDVIDKGPPPNGWCWI
jgi:dolichyl-phosphate-mannose-protein mannosyltransferase